MKIERTRNATRNIIVGTIFKIYSMLMPFIMRTIMIYVLGVNYLGLNGLFTSVLQVLNLAETGVGAAMVFSMYQPIASDNHEKICMLMRLYKVYYRIIGTVVLMGGIFITPFLKYLIKSDIPDNINIYILYFMNLASTVSTYWLFSYKTSLLFAHQRSDVSTKVSLVTETCKYLLQAMALICFRSYYLYTIIIVFTQIVANLITALITNKMYPSYKAKGLLPREEIKVINKKIKDLFMTKIGTVIFNSADTLVISAFLGLRVLAIYQNYFYIVTSITGIVGIIFTSCTAGIGNSLITETEEKNYTDLKKLTLLICWLTGFCSVCLLCLFQPFMKLWVTEKLMLQFSAVICFCAYFFVNHIYLLFELYKDAAGMWHEDRFRPMVVSFINLCLNLILVQFIGVYGVLIASCLAKGLFGLPWVLYNLFHVVFHRSPWNYIKRLLYYVFTSVIVSTVVFAICTLVTCGGIVELAAKLTICCLIGNSFFWILLRRDSQFKAAIGLLQRFLPEKFKRLIH